MKKARTAAIAAAIVLIIDSLSPSIVSASSVTDLQQQAENIVNEGISRLIEGGTGSSDNEASGSAGQADQADTRDDSTSHDHTVEINSRTDFDTLVENCHTDSWSSDKNVILNRDLDFENKEFTPLENFGGTFNGNGHTLKNVKLSGDVSESGVFGTIRRSGRVINLNVTGKITPSDTQDELGGIAGINYGTIDNCSFKGTISADRRLGGIAGRNGLYGTVVNCTASGKMTGKAACGGIVGYNEGTVRGCTNEMKVNTTYRDTTLTVDELTSTLDNALQSGSLLNTENFELNGDSGGIAGFSSGVITSCTNNATIGYEHVGNNIGGIAGRSSGFLQGNTNNGTIYGRKDTGGIAGQMQPYLSVDFSEDSLKDLDSQLDSLDKLINTSLNQTDSYTSATLNHLQNINTLAGDARDSVNAIAKESADQVDEAAQAVNNTVNSVQNTLSSFSDMAARLDSFFAEIKNAGDSLSSSLSTYIGSLELPEDVRNQLNQYVSDFLAASGNFNTDLQNFRTALSQGNAAETIDLSKIQESLEQIRSAHQELSSAIDYVNNALTSYTEGYADREQAASGLFESVQKVKDALNSYPDISTDLSGAFDSLASLHLQMNGISSSLRQNGNALYQSLGQMQTELNSMNTGLSDAAGKSTDSLKSIATQVNTIVHTLKDALNDLKDTDSGRSLEDISDQDIQNVYEGRAASCVNYGEVEADTNTGGIVGIMGVEFELDPDSDIKTSGDTSLDYIFRMRCIVDRCTNNGIVRARDSYCGGIAGQMEMGLVTGSGNYGNIDSESSYVGGIAGYTSGAVKDSFSKCDLTGKKYVGGIAGYGVSLSGNYAMVNTIDTEEYVGAVAGKVKNTDTSAVSGNYYYSDSLYGIDSVSYSGIAESLSYDQLVRKFPDAGTSSGGSEKTTATGDQNSADRFTQLVLTFVADDVVIKTLNVSYGESVPENQIPEIPEKDGFYGEWSRTDFSSITADETVNAEYSRINTLLSSAATRKSGPSVLEVTGKFHQNDTLKLSAMPTEGSEIERWSVHIPDDGSSSHEIRYLAPDESTDAEIYQIKDGHRSRVKTSDNGTYITFKSGKGTDLTFAVEESAGNVRTVLIAVCAAAACAVVILLLIRHFRKKKKTASST